jgi:hypothetical protein
MPPAQVGPDMGQPTGVTAEGWWFWSNKSAAIFPRDDKCIIHSLFTPKTVCAWWRAITYGRWLCAEHSRSKGVNLQKQSPTYGVSAVPMGWMAVGESVVNGALWDTRQPPSCIVALPSMGALLGGLFFPRKWVLSELMYESSREVHLFPWWPHLGNQVGGSLPGPFRDK